MPESVQTSRLQEAIDTVESLSIEEQNLIVEILLKRLQRKRRENLLQEIEEVRQEASEGQIQFGSVEDFLKELDS
jgi:predicted GIY-YIG superfamily endonuclease